MPEIASFISLLWHIWGCTERNDLCFPFLTDELYPLSHSKHGCRILFELECSGHVWKAPPFQLNYSCVKHTSFYYIKRKKEKKGKTGTTNCQMNIVNAYRLGSVLAETSISVPVSSCERLFSMLWILINLIFLRKKTAKTFPFWAVCVLWSSLPRPVFFLLLGWLSIHHFDNTFFNTQWRRKSLFLF